MEGIAKSAPQPSTQTTTTTPTPTSTETPAGTLIWEGVPIDLYRQWNINLGTIPQQEISKLKDIYEWAKTKCDEPTIGNVLQKISSLENSLGSPAIGEKRWDKVWNFIRLQRQIDDLEKRRDAIKLNAFDRRIKEQLGISGGK